MTSTSVQSVIYSQGVDNLLLCAQELNIFSYSMMVNKVQENNCYRTLTLSERQCSENEDS